MQKLIPRSLPLNYKQHFELNQILVIKLERYTKILKPYLKYKATK